MKNYKEQILELSREITDEIFMKEKDPSYVPAIDRNSVARSLSVIYDEDLRKTTDDLSIAIRKEISKRKRS